MFHKHRESVSHPSAPTYSIEASPEPAVEVRPDEAPYQVLDVRGLKALDVMVDRGSFYVGRQYGDSGMLVYGWGEDEYEAVTRAAEALDG